MSKESNIDQGQDPAQEAPAPAQEAQAPAPAQEASVEEAPVEEAPVEKVSSLAQESSSEVGAADAAEGLLAKLKEELKGKEGLEALFNNLEARVSGDAAHIDKATPDQVTSDKGNSGQGTPAKVTPAKVTPDQEASDQEASDESKKEEKPKSTIGATKDYLVASAGALLDFLIEMLAGIKKFVNNILQGNEGKTQAKTGSDVVSNNSQEQASKDNTTVSPTQISPSQKAESPLKVDGRNTRDVLGDPTSEETQP